MANSQSVQIARYFEKVLGLSKVEASFFAQDPPVQNPQPLVAPIKCWLVNSPLSDSSAIQPSIQEMASKLKVAIEAEWVKHGLSGKVVVDWLTSDDYKRFGNVGHEQGLVIFFGEQTVTRREHSASSIGVLMPRLDEMNLNPSLKKDAWRKIQSEIARFGASLGSS